MHQLIKSITQNFTKSQNVFDLNNCQFFSGHVVFPKFMKYFIYISNQFKFNLNSKFKFKFRI